MTTEPPSDDIPPPPPEDNAPQPRNNGNHMFMTPEDSGPATPGPPNAGPATAGSTARSPKPWASASPPHGTASNAACASSTPSPTRPPNAPAPRTAPGSTPPARSHGGHGPRPRPRRHGKVVTADDQGEVILDDGPKLAAAGKVKELSESLASHGLDAPTQVNLGGDVTYQIVGVDPDALS
jgi:hypothetical protein